MGAHHSHSDGFSHRRVSKTADTHFTLSEIHKLHKVFSKLAHEDGTINKEDFKKALENNVSAWSVGAQYLFLDRLFDAFDNHNKRRIDFDEFIQGLSVFFKGTDEEKQELSFRFFDIDKNGTIEPQELIRILAQMYTQFYNEDFTPRVKEIVHQIFKDLDINGDGVLTLHEFKLMAVKEPMIVNFVEEFLRMPSKQEQGAVFMTQ